MRDVDYTSTVEFLRHFFAGTDDNVELRCIGNNGGAGAPLFTRDPEEVKAYCRVNDVAGKAVYFACGTRLVGKRQGRREELAELVAAWLDVDCLKLGLLFDDVVDALKGCPCPPSLIVMSGGGIHAYWLLREPLCAVLPVDGPDLVKEEFDGLLKRLAACFAGDVVVAQVAAVMRLPGSHNSKRGEPVRAVVLWDDGGRYEVADLEEMLDQVGGPLIVSPNLPGLPAQEKDEADPFLSYGRGAALGMDVEAERVAMRLHHPDAQKGLHNFRLRASAHYVAKGRPDEEIFLELIADTQREVIEGGEKWTASREREEAKKLRDEIEGAHRRGYAPKYEPELPKGVVRLHPRQQERPDDDPLPPRMGERLPVIHVEAGHLAETASLAEQLLLDYGAPFYARTTKMMRPVVEDDWAADGIKTKVARLTEVSPVFMRDTLSRLAAWKKYDKRPKAWVPCDPPKEIAETVLGRNGEWLAPPVAGVITTPTIRPDGSILREEGYDPATRLILLSPPPMPAIPDKPARAQAQAALCCLNDLLTEFCFVDEASRAVALSAMMTPVVRGALPVVPAHVMRAPVAGSGKSYLVDLAAAISTGQRCPVISAGKDEMEQEKRLGAALMAGQAIVSIDNLNGELKGDALCQMVERPLVLVRILGKSELMRIETRASLFATGNNIVVVGDMVRRTLTSSMDANVERPELREFKQKPLMSILADRGKYVAAVLTIVRAYQQAGYPGSLAPLASYDNWSLMIRSALVWLDCADPASTIDTSRENDPELVALGAVVGAWQKAVTIGESKTASELIALADLQVSHKNELDETVWEAANPDLAEALSLVARGRRGPDATMLGKWLSGQQNRVIGSLKVVRTGLPTHAKKWKLSS